MCVHVLQCSVSCGKGKRARYVSCRDAQGGVADESYCAHLPRPPESSACFSPCGQWRAGEWSPVSNRFNTVSNQCRCFPVQSLIVITQLWFFQELKGKSHPETKWPFVIPVILENSVLTCERQRVSPKAGNERPEQLYMMSWWLKCLGVVSLAVKGCWHSSSATL